VLWLPGNDRLLRRPFFVLVTLQRGALGVRGGVWGVIRSRPVCTPISRNIPQYEGTRVKKREGIRLIRLGLTKKRYSVLEALRVRMWANERCFCQPA
jgi:hypothetical protein